MFLGKTSWGENRASIAAPFLRKGRRPVLWLWHPLRSKILVKVRELLILQGIPFSIIQYVYFDMFESNLSLFAHKSSNYQEMTSSIVSFCSLFVENSKKVWSCLMFSEKELKIPLIDKLNFIHSWAHTTQCTLDSFYFWKNVLHEKMLLFFLHHFRNLQVILFGFELD